MQAKDVMTTDVVSVGPQTPVGEIARLLLEHHISAVPVVDADGHVQGIVSEADLIHELGREGRPRRWWLDLLTSPGARAEEYLKGHGRVARDVMTTPVHSVEPQTPLAGIVRLMEARRVKRVAVVRGGRLLGIVSRADLLRAFALQPPVAPLRVDDHELRERLIAAFESAGLNWHPYVNVIVSDGSVHLWGIVHAPEEAEAFRVAAEGVPGVLRVENHLRARSAMRSL